MNKYRVTFAYPIGDDWHTMQVVVKARNENRAIEIVISHWKKSKWHHVDVLELSQSNKEEEES